MLLAIFLLIFGAVGLAAFELLRPKPDIVGRRLQPMDAQVPEIRRPRLEGGVRQRLVAPAVSRAGRWLARLLPQNWIRGVDRMLMHANEPWSLAGFMGTWTLVSAAALVLAVYLNGSMRGSGLVLRLFVVVLVVGLGVLLPLLRLRSLEKRRQKAITRALPDAIDLLTTSVEAGLGVDAAFALVVDKTDGPLSETFALYLRQIGLGRGREDALMYVADRTGVPDLLAIAHNVNQGEALGTPLGDVLRQQADELRLARRQRALEAAQKAPALMTIPMALCFLPAMGAVIVVPSLLNLMRFVGQLGK